MVNELVEICMVYIFLDEMTIVKNYLEKLKGMNEKTSVTVLYSIIYYTQKKYEKSINMIEKIVNVTDKPVDVIFALEMYKSVPDKELLKKILNQVINKYKAPEHEPIIDFINENYKPYLEEKKSNKTT